MPVRFDENDQRIITHDFREELDFSPQDLRQWFTTNRVIRTIAHLFAYDGSRQVRVRVNDQGYLLTEGSKETLAKDYYVMVSGTGYTLQSDVVPSNEIWVLTHIMAVNYEWNGHTIELGIAKLTNVARLYFENYGILGEPVIWQGLIYLTPGWYVYADFNNVGIGNHIRMSIAGYILK